MVRSRIVSSDMNGTFTGPTGRAGHTMSHMIAVHAGEDAFKQAKAVFDRQTSGELGERAMEIAFGNAALHYKGMTLRRAIEYAIEIDSQPVDSTTRIKYVAGFWDFLAALSEEDRKFLINSTGYDVTVNAVQEQAKLRLRSKNPILDFSIGNHLLFDERGSEEAPPKPGLVVLPYRELISRKNEMETLVRDYFERPDGSEDHIFDMIVASGNIHLGLPKEDAKATAFLAYVQEFHPDVKVAELAHIGDTMGDVGGILGVARAGGKGIAFNYNKPLEGALCVAMAKEPALGSRIYFVDPKGTNSNFMNVLPVLEK